MPTWVSQEKWNLCQHFKFHIFEFDLMGWLPGVGVCCIVFLMALNIFQPISHGGEMLLLCSAQKGWRIM